MREKGSGTRNAIERCFAECAITLHPRLELDSNEAITQAILAGLGISALSRHALSRLTKNSCVVYGRLAEVGQDGRGRA
jgi:DNA-binding transcriptional LysR family regulator